MDVRAGTSGYSYDAWTGPFYPEGLPAGERLAFYATRLDTVEVNNTFYRMPRSAVLRAWADSVPAGFLFAIKATRRITHQRRLVGVEETLEYLRKGLVHLGPALGPVLFQLPPNLKKDLERLGGFLELLPEGLQAALEFRHASWADEEVDDLLRRHAVCRVACDDGGELERLVPTAEWGYLRLRRPEYGDEELRALASRITDQPWGHAFCFFKHEDAGAGPALASRFLELLHD